MRRLIRIIYVRLVVEKSTTHDKFYPRVISASTQCSYPFSVSTADIEVISNLAPKTSGYAAPLHFDDIVRLQVSVKNYRTEHTVWQDIFHGRIMEMSSDFGNNSNKLKLFCVGHEFELSKDLIAENKAYTSSTDAKTLLSYFSKYYSRLTYSDSLTSTGVIFPTYDTTLDQNFLDTLVSDMEKQSGYDYMFTTKPVYNSSQSLSAVYSVWKPLSSTVTSSYRAVEGTQRLVEANFSSNGEDVVTYQKVYGATPETATVTGTTAAKPFTGTVSGSTCSGTTQSTTVTGTASTPAQYKGAYYDPTLEAQIGRRSAVDTYTWIQSNSLCTTIAQGLQTGAGVPVISGQVKLIGTPQAQLGDLVYVKLPSLEVNGESVIGNFTVYRVSHEISKDNFNTTLDLGSIKKTAEDYIVEVKKVAKLCKCSLVRKSTA